jgi:DNA-binding NarL/FixJ family response regulator
MSVRLLVADDHPLVRAGVKLCVQGKEFSVVAEAGDGAETLQAALEHRPDVILLDVRMPRLDGLECLAQLREQLPAVPVCMLSASDNPTYAARAKALGAVGYLPKTVPLDELVSALRQAAAGEVLWSNGDQPRVRESTTASGMDNGIDSLLTKREVEVLRQLALGLSNKEIALALAISYETVKEHIQHILRKLKVADRTQAAVWAVRNSLV